MSSLDKEKETMYTKLVFDLERIFVGSEVQVSKAIKRIDENSKGRMKLCPG